MSSNPKPKAQTFWGWLLTQTARAGSTGEFALWAMRLPNVHFGRPKRGADLASWREWMQQTPEIPAHMIDWMERAWTEYCTYLRTA